MIDLCQVPVSYPEAKESVSLTRMCPSTPSQKNTYCFLPFKWGNPGYQNFWTESLRHLSVCAELFCVEFQRDREILNSITGFKFHIHQSNWLTVFFQIPPPFMK